MQNANDNIQETFPYLQRCHFQNQHQFRLHNIVCINLYGSQVSWNWISKVPVIKCDFICRVGLAGCRYVSESRMSHQKYSNVGQKEERGIWVNISFLSFLFLTLKLQMVFYRWSTWSPKEYAVCIRCGQFIGSGYCVYPG